MFFQKIKNFFKKNTNEEFQKAEVVLDQTQLKENNFESSQIEIEQEPVIKKTKRSLKQKNNN
jgi:hypothetical protein